MSKNEKYGSFPEYIVHIIGWGVIFLFPLFFNSNREDEPFNFIEYVRHSIVPGAFCLVFYINYLLLVPRYMFRGKFMAFIVINSVIIMIFCAMTQIFSFKFAPGPPPPDPMIKAGRSPHLMLFLRDMVSMVLVTGLAAAIRMGNRIAEVEEARKEAEMQNLKSQINPHFLLNTLNNIYALIEFDPLKAQTAVQELSRLLRYALYDIKQNLVPMHKEISFIHNYIALMEIRLPDDVRISTAIDVSEDSTTLVPPLLFISLIENAFKHGISSTGNNFIRIRIFENEREIHCEIVNSCHPKNSSDKSGSGIGLEQVQKRLDLMYKGKYRWDKGEDSGQKEYHSYLVLKK